MASIRVTPEVLEGQGNELKSYAEELATILQNVDNKLREVDESWDGLAQDAFFGMYEEMKESLDKFPEVVNSLGEATVGVAQTFAQVDEELKNQFA